MKTAVFGGTGWVGHHIVLSCLEAGHDVTIVSRGGKSTHDHEIPDDVPRIKADKSSEADVARVFERQYDVVIDSVPTEASIDHIVKHAKGIKHYLHCSSTGGYAPLERVPADETHPYGGFFGGGWAQKGVVDGKVLAMHQSQGFPATVIRPSYITGPGMDPLDNIGGRRPDFIADVLASKPLDLPDNGLALLHPVHVRDLGRSFLLAADRPAVSIGEIYNICLGRAVTLNRYIELTAAALDRQATINYMTIDAILAKYGENVHEVGLRFLATHMCFDLTKARTQLDYEPHCTVEEAIAENARWTAKQY
jgi:nucleoside-diphosphate-sugar epimerase